MSPSRAMPRLEHLKKQLRATGIAEAQVDRLVQFVEVFGPAWLAPLPPMNDVRDAISRMRATVNEFRKHSEGMFGAGRQGAPRYAEAQSRILAAIKNADLEQWQQFERLPAMLGTLETACDDALAEIAPPLQRRSMAAHWLPVAKIWEALVEGQPAGEPLSEHLLPSSSPGSVFREICAACYAFMTGKPDADPVRAIRAFVRLWKGTQASARDRAAQSKTLRVTGGPRRPKRAVR